MGSTPICSRQLWEYGGGVAYRFLKLWWPHLNCIASVCVSSAHVLLKKAWPGLYPLHFISVQCYHWGLHRWSRTGCTKWIHYAKTKFKKPLFFSVDLVIFWLPYKHGKLNLWQSIQKMWIINPLMCGLCMFLHLNWFTFLWLLGKMKVRGKKTTAAPCPCSDHLNCTY